MAAAKKKRVAKKKAVAKKKPVPMRKPRKPPGPGYDPKKHDAIAEKAAAEGHTNEGIGYAMGVTGRTMERWAKANPSLKEAIARGKAIPDSEVQSTLLRRARGYEYTEVKSEGVVSEKTGKIVGTKVTKTTKHVPPDTGAIIYWLKNRMKHLWRDRWEEPPRGDGESVRPVTSVNFITVDARKRKPKGKPPEEVESRGA